jgi:hypothetical protein
MYLKNGMISLVAKQVFWLMQSLIELPMNSYQINITSIDPEHDRFMRKVYGLNKALCE